MDKRHRHWRKLDGDPRFLAKEEINKIYQDSYK